MTADILEITRVIRRMPGGAQAYMVQAEDNQFYIAKFAGNPQGNRTLINEWLGYRLLQRLGVCTPEMRVLRMTQLARDAGVEVYFSVDKKKIAVEPGLNLGSQCPVDPSKTSIFDFLPRKLLASVVNLNDFAKVYVFDTLVGHTDSRQAIFVRERRVQTRFAFRAYFIDHGLILSGATWNLQKVQPARPYFDQTVYSLINMEVCCEAAIMLASAISEEAITSAIEEIPGEWFREDDAKALATVHLSLRNRQIRLRSLVLQRNPLMASLAPSLSAVSGYTRRV